MPTRLSCLLVLLVCAAPPAQAQPEAPSQTEHVILVTLDGLRWEELFTGADPWLLRNDDYVRDADGLAERFWDDDPAVRRQRLMPFFWDTIAVYGQLHGWRTEGSRVDVTNGHRFSYPGYNEILTGRADDDRIDSNAKRPNPNVTVLEHANRQPGFEGRVAALGSWDVFPYIVNEVRSGVPVNAGFEAATGDDVTPLEQTLNTLQAQIPSPWATVRLDAFTHHYALETLRAHRPRLLYIAYGETDDFAHDGRYDHYLDAAHRTDAFIRELWTWTQSQPDYQGRTTLLITTDHGRGPRDAWTGHGADVAGAEAIWFAVLGPDTPPRGAVQADAQHYQNQVAATVARLLGLPPLPGAGPALDLLKP